MAVAVISVMKRYVTLATPHCNTRLILAPQEGISGSKVHKSRRSAISKP